MAEIAPRAIELSLEQVEEVGRFGDVRAFLRECLRETLEAPEPLTVDEWADEYRVLPPQASSEPGRWRTDRTPYLREVMRCLSAQDPCKRVVLMAGTQVGKTETGNNWLGWIMHQVPGPVMVVVPTQALAKRWSRQRLQPMIDATPVLAGLVKPARKRDSGNTTLLKQFPGGLLVIAGANSAVDLRSMPVRFLFADEVDGYPDDVDGEGSPLTLAERRTSTFPRRKLFIVSTPTIKDASVIEHEFLGGDQRHYHVPCPHCEHMQVLRDEQLHDDGMYECEACGKLIAHEQKNDMLARGEWRARNPGAPYPSFHLSALYAPVGLGYTWAEIAAERERANKSGRRELIQAYYNTLLGLPYEDESGKIDWKELRDRAGGYSSRTIPDGCMILTAAVDVQDDRFAVLILGWGRGERCWVIDWFELPADPGLEDHWNKLDEHVLDRTFVNGYGVELPISAMAVDTGGHFTHMAYNYCRLRRHRKVLAVKGDRFPNRPIIAGRPSKQDVNTRGGILRDGVELWRVGTDTAKGAIYSKLAADAGEPDIERHSIRFPDDLQDDFFMQLTSERYDAKSNRWRRLSGRRNEVLDCFVYAYAAACHPSIRVHMLRKKDWDKIEQKIQPGAVADDEGSEEKNEQHNTDAVAMRRQRTRGNRRRGFVKRWRG